MTSSHSKQWGALGLAFAVAVCLWLYFNGRLASFDEPDPSLAPGSIRRLEALEDSGDRDPSDLTSGPIRMVTQAVRREIVEGRAVGQIQVRDTSGNPLPGAELFPLDEVVTFRARDFPCAPSDRQSPLGSSDANGLIPITTPQRTRIYAVFKQGFDPTMLRVGERIEAQIEATLSIALGPRLVVVNSNGEPVESARVLFDVNSWGWPIEGGNGQYFDVGQTNSFGELRVGRGAGVGTRGVIAAAGYCLTSFEPSPLADTIPVELQRAATVSGAVIGVREREHLFAVAERRGGGVGDLLFASRIEDSGQFHFEALAEGLEWMLTPCRRVPGQWERVGESVSVVPPAADVKLPSGAPTALRVRALDPAGASLKPRVLSSLMPYHVLADGALLGTRVEGDGSYAWPSVRWGGAGHPHATSELWIVADGFRAVSVGEWSFAAGSTIDLGDIVLDPVEVWEVHVVESGNDGAPIPGAWVGFTPSSVMKTHTYDDPWLQRATTDEAGIARLSAPVGISGIVHAGKSGWSKQSRTIESGEFVQTTLELSKPALVSVTCVSGNGSRVPRASLQWRPSSSSGKWTNVYAGEDGVAEWSVEPSSISIRYAPGALRGFSTTGAVIEVDVHSSTEGQPSPSAPIEVIDLTPGEHRSEMIELPTMTELDVAVSMDGLPAVGYRLIGIPGSSLNVVANDLWSRLDLPKAVVDSSGLCRLSGLPIGRITLVAIDPRTNLASELVIQSGRPIRMTVVFAMSSKGVTVEVVDAKGNAMAAVPLQLTQRSARVGTIVPDLFEITPAGAVLQIGSPARVVAAMTNNFGKALFHGLPRDAVFEVSCTSPDDYPLLKSAVIHSLDKEVHFVLRDGLGSVLELTLFDLSGREHANMPVILRAVEGASSEYQGTTDATGRIVFSALEPGVYAVIMPSGDNEQFQVRTGEHRLAKAALR